MAQIIKAALKIINNAQIFRWICIFAVSQRYSENSLIFFLRYFVITYQQAITKF